MVGDDHMRAFDPEDADHPLEGLIVIPESPGLLKRFRKAEILLVQAIDMACAQELRGLECFVGTDDPEFLIQLRAGLVLPAFPPIRQENGGLDSKSTVIVGQSLAILIIRVGRHTEEAKRSPHFKKGLPPKNHSMIRGQPWEFLSQTGRPRKSGQDKNQRGGQAYGWKERKAVGSVHKTKSTMKTDENHDRL
jgi:hypothetical protein